MLFVFALVLLTGSLVFAKAAGEATSFTIPSVHYPSTTGGELSQTELQFLRFNLERHGVVAFTHIPGFADARTAALAGLGQCYQANGISPTRSLRIELADGTRRTTLASASASGTGKEEESSAVESCPGLQHKLDALQSVVAQASLAFARALDSSVLRHAPLLMAVDNASGMQSYDSFASLVEHGQHLDHFHVYEKTKSMKQEEEQEPALGRHSDQGLFVAITPALTVGGRGGGHVDDGFELELADGRMVKVDFPHAGDALLFMVGDGMANWISPQAVHSPLRSAPHRLVMPSASASSSPSSSRVWFGRMFFPPSDAFLAKVQTTFAKFRQLSVEETSGDKKAPSVAFVGCSNQRHVLRDLTESACGADEIYCWMACQSTANVHCQSPSASIQCVDPSDQSIWDDSKGHCTSCAPQCVGEDEPDDVLPSDDDSGGICNTRISPTNMYMNGFNGLGTNLNCLVFLFQPWVLNSQVKYAFGALGAFAVAFAVELIILLRRELRLPGKQRHSTVLRRVSVSPAPSAVLLVLYAAQLVLAYFAMLLAMSFATVIFVMIMLGFVCGHALFNFEQQPRGNEACCNVNEPLLARGGVGRAASPLCSNNSPTHQQQQQPPSQPTRAQQQQEESSCCGPASASASHSPVESVDTA